MLPDGEVTVEEALDAGPIACSLERAEQAERRKRWQRLGDRAVLAVAPTGRGVRLEFRRGPGVEAELGELAALERVCCAFADWSLGGDSHRLALDVSGHTDEGVAAVQAMFGTMREQLAGGGDLEK